MHIYVHLILGEKSSIILYIYIWVIQTYVKQITLIIIRIN